MSKVAIIGGGAAGMLCGVHMLRADGHQVHILEKNEKARKKAFHHRKGTMQRHQ